MNEKGLMRFSAGMFALGQVLKKNNNKEKELFKKNNYYNPFRLPQMNHPVFGELFTTTVKGVERNEKAKETAEKICDEIYRLENIEMIPLYYKEGASTIKIKVKPITNIKKSFNIQRQIKYIVGNEEARIYPEGDRITIEIPNKGNAVRFGNLINDVKYKINQSKTYVPIGENIEGETVFGDIKEMPHMLVAGATGSGKSVFINGIIASLLIKNTPYDMKMILIDPKMVEFRMYAELDYVKYVTEIKEAIEVLNSLCVEMDKRYDLMASKGCRNIETYNEKYKNVRLPKILLVVDEMADMIINKAHGKEVERNIIRLAQKARACGIHMVLATQRPSREVVTGLIKANIPCRACLAVTSRTESMIMLDQTGAEKLQGHGDMLFLDGINNREPKRLQAGLITDNEIKNLVISLALDNQPEYANKFNWNNKAEEIRKYYGRA